MYVYCRYIFRLTLIDNRFSNVTLIHLVLYLKQQQMKINVREHQRAMINEEANNPEKLATQGTQDEENKHKKTTQYVLDANMRKQTQIT